MNARTLMTVLLTLALAATTTAADKADLKQAAKDATEAFSRTNFVAKLDLRRYARHFVLPDGSPAPQKTKKQGRGGEGAIQFDSGIKVRAGEVGEGIFVGAGKKDTIMVAFNPKRKVLNAVVVTILFDREVTADDFDPYRLARAVSSVVEIRGFEPGAEIAAAFDEALEAIPEAASAAAAPPTSATATVLSLSAWAEPDRVRPGDTVQLMLDYRVQAPAGNVIAVETRKLSLDGEMMPTYPVAEEVSRAAGSYTSNYRQPLPPSARPGIYTFQGEVCVGGDCIQRSASFEVVE